LRTFQGTIGTACRITCGVIATSCSQDTVGAARSLLTAPSPYPCARAFAAPQHDAQIRSLAHAVIIARLAELPQRGLRS
jgi:hypothetical protein